MSTDHRIALSDAAKQMGLKTKEVKLMVFASKLDGGNDKHGWWVDDRAVKLWLENH